MKASGEAGPLSDAAPFLEKPARFKSDRAWKTAIPRNIERAWSQKGRSSEVLGLRRILMEWLDHRPWRVLVRGSKHRPCGQAEHRFFGAGGGLLVA